MRVHDKLQQKAFSSAAEEAMVSLMMAGGQLMQRVDTLCREHGITHDQYNVLRILRGAGRSGHPRFEIANRLVSRAPDVTRLVDRLERQGLVERSWDPGNRRLSVARITTAGLDLLKKIDPALQALHAESAGDLTEDELRTLARLCDRVIR